MTRTLVGFFFLYVFVSFAMFNSGATMTPLSQFISELVYFFDYTSGFATLFVFFMFVFLATLTDFCFVFTR